MNWKSILKGGLALVLSYIGWNLLDYIKGLLSTQTLPSFWDVALGIIGVVAIITAMFLFSDVWSSIKLARREIPPPVEKASQPALANVETTFDLDTIEPKLKAILKLGYRNLLKQDLIEIRQRLYNMTQPRDEPFKVWNTPAANAKAQLLDDEIIYNAVEEFSTSLNERNKRLKTNDTTFSAWNMLCLKHYDKFKEIGFIT